MAWERRLMRWMLAVPHSVPLRNCLSSMSKWVPLNQSFQNTPMLGNERETLLAAGVTTNCGPLVNVTASLDIPIAASRTSLRSRAPLASLILLDLLLTNRRVGCPQLCLDTSQP